MLYTSNTYNFCQLSTKLKKNLTPSIILAWKIPWTEEPGKDRKVIPCKKYRKTLEKVQVNNRMKISTFSVCLNHANAIFIYM